MRKIFCIFLILFLTGCVNKNEPYIPYVSYDSVKYTKEDLSKTYQGYIDRALDVDLSFGLSGVIKDIYVYEGALVKKGQRLARLDNDEYSLNIKKAELNLQDAHIKYDKAKSYYERITKLHKAGGISFNDWETAETDLKSSEIQIKLLEDSLKIAKNRNSFSEIIAPYNGYIIKVYKDEGQYAKEGENIIYFQGMGMDEARIFVPQDEINDIKTGENVILRADAIKNKEFKGKIKSKVNSSFKDGSYRVTVSILDDTEELKDGMSVNVILKRKDKPRIYIPLSSIIIFDDKNFVYILDKDSKTVFKKEIETGKINNDTIEVKFGLNIGDFVVDNPVWGLEFYKNVEFSE